MGHCHTFAFALLASCSYVFTDLHTQTHTCIQADSQNTVSLVEKKSLSVFILLSAQNIKYYNHMHPRSPLQCKHLASFGRRGDKGHEFLHVFECLLIIVYLLPQNNYYNEKRSIIINTMLLINKTYFYLNLFY